MIVYNKYLGEIDGLRKAGDAPGHKIVVAGCVCILLLLLLSLSLLLLLLLFLSWACYVVPCGAGNDHLFCPTGTGPQDITTSIKHCNLQCFLFPPRTKQRYLRCFLFREHQNRVKTLVFTMFWQQPKTQV